MKAILALMAMAVSALAAPNDPGETALHFLEKVRAKNLNLEPGTDTALSPQTSGKKRKEINRRLERIASDLGEDSLEVGPTKLDGDFAAVLVRKIGGFDPSRLQIFPVALVKRGAGWSAAPVPASFENSGVGYASGLRKRLQSLEDWMLREQALDLENLRAQSVERMRQSIEKHLSATTLGNFTSQQAAARFLAACEHRKLPEILGLLGGLSANLPDNWALRLKAADDAVAAGSDVKRPWRLLIAPEVLRVPVHHDEDEDGNGALCSVACLDPAATSRQTKPPKIEFIHLPMSRTAEGFWQIDPAADFIQDTPAPDEDDPENLDSDLLDRFPAKLSIQYPAAPKPTAAEAKAAVLAAFGNPQPASWVKLIRLEGEPSAMRNACAQAARTWWNSQNPDGFRKAVPLAFHPLEQQAAAACQVFDARNPDRLNLEFLFFEKTPAGWLWAPSPSSETRAALREWTDLQTTLAPTAWRQALLTDCPVLEQVPPPGAPSTEESRKLVESWLQATRAGDVEAALRLTTRLTTPASATYLFRNLGHEITAARRARSITAIQRGETWTMVGTQTDSAGKPSFPLYPIINTQAGPRILLEIDLAAADNRSRGFLNKTSLQRLRKIHPAAADELDELVAKHLSEIVPPPPPSPAP